MTNPPTALVLGGTEFVGRHLVEALLRAGHDVTLFNRGITNPDLFESLPRLIGDRTGDTSALAGREWDVVFDVSAYHPGDVDRIAEHLVGNCGHYVFVSTISVYASFPTPRITEDAPVAVLDGPVPDAADMGKYGELKALCEARVTDLYPGATIVRPTIIAGPDDPTDRFTYWVTTLASPGPHIVPDDLDRALQYIDVRDLADWLVLAAITRPAGPFNIAAAPIRFADLFDTIATATGTPLDVITLTDEQQATENVRPWLDLPLCLPSDEQARTHLFEVDTSLAIAAGLRIRPLRTTVLDTLAWAGQRGTPLITGLTPQRDADLAARYSPS